MHKKITLVTALFDIGRGDLDDSFKRGFDHYLDSFKVLLNVDYPMVIFADERVEQFVWENGRSRENTVIIRKTVDDLRNFPFYSEVQEIRNDDLWRNQVGWLADSTQARLDLYNPLVMSKQFFLNDAAIYNNFDSHYYYWIDAGIANTVGNIGEYLHDRFEDWLVDYTAQKMLFLAFPYDKNAPEIHGFVKTRLDELSGTCTTHVMRGGFFGGPKEIIHEFNDLYYKMLAETLQDGYMGTEESIFTILAYAHPEIVKSHQIGSDGLIYKFFEDLEKIYRNNGEKPDMGVVIYVLAYNIPEQVEMWVDSFKAAYPVFWRDVRKVLIDNTVDEERKKRFRDEIYPLFDEVLEFDNIGICGGRHAAAVHFDQSNFKHMIFFEDDMLLHGPDAVGTPCKFGFVRYHPETLHAAIAIVERENLDYLKLSYSEVYGDNSENWAWFNIGQDRRDEIFPRKEDGSHRYKTRIEKMDSYKSLPYAVGDFFYCNWPLVFSKSGNRKIFLDDEYEHKYEQTWMSIGVELSHAGKLRTGCLLASPINHHRAHFYDGRKENEHG